MRKGSRYEREREAEGLLVKFLPAKYANMGPIDHLATVRVARMLVIAGPAGLGPPVRYFILDCMFQPTQPTVRTDGKGRTMQYMF